VNLSFFSLETDLTVWKSPCCLPKLESGKLLLRRKINLFKFYFKWITWYKTIWSLIGYDYTVILIWAAWYENIWEYI
jgi:hypothetical protein